MRRVPNAIEDYFFLAVHTKIKQQGNRLEQLHIGCL